MSSPLPFAPLQAEGPPVIRADLLPRPAPAARKDRP
jgi:hypothetical protein